MTWSDTRDAELRRRFEEGENYSQIASAFRTTRNAIAGRCFRLGLKRPPKPPSPKRSHKRKPRMPSSFVEPPNTAEREQDQRDIDMLCDLDEGHTQQDVADHWGVTRNIVRNLQRHARRAA